ncbi:ABC transporter ATP-binding protein [Plantactinospora endophytica]|uniref:ABC transporter ATP-binding protein n=1 Tax=Plantactinospora endophytica TaxID=673535 RepID=A0ABQ4ECB5_9ACTN|nr:ATP-binding cassette domain-containing protein [Plantactinospora endophytica]GIG92299.1 ABC transporter ATP-binding protein [Plantactinospora endophytica]
MSDSAPVIQVSQLTKRYRGKAAVDSLSFTVQPGRVTGFLGPNGAGKSTTMQLMLGLTRPDEGSATVGGRPYRELVQPLRTVGALLEARSVHPGRSAYHHLLWLAQSQRLPRRRVDEVLDLVGLGDVAHQRAGGFSLGMGQRLDIAAAMLGDPGVLLLDEPVNGLDPAGVRWIRDLMKRLAAEGRTVFVSSHLVNEMAVTADHLIVIGRGKLIADCPTVAFVADNSESSVLVRSPEVHRLAQLVVDEGAQWQRESATAVRIRGLDSDRIAELALLGRIVVQELRTETSSLEDVFMRLTEDQVEYAGKTKEATP